MIIYARMLVYKDAIECYGEDTQLTVAQEEMAELTKEICKYKRGKGFLEGNKNCGNARKK